MQAPTQTLSSTNPHIAFIGGGNMASALIGGLLKRGLTSSQIQVVEPFAEQRAKLVQQFQVEVSETPGASLNRATLVVWAVKPQTFREAAEQSRASRTISFNQMRPGDLIFFRTSGSSVNHVGIYTGRGQFIHAASGGAKVSVDNLSRSYWQQRLVKFGRILA